MDVSGLKSVNFTDTKLPPRYPVTVVYFTSGGVHNSSLNLIIIDNNKLLYNCKLNHSKANKVPYL